MSGMLWEAEESLRIEETTSNLTAAKTRWQVKIAEPRRITIFIAVLYIDDVNAVRVAKAGPFDDAYKRRRKIRFKLGRNEGLDE